MFGFLLEFSTRVGNINSSTLRSCKVSLFQLKSLSVQRCPNVHLLCSGELTALGKAPRKAVPQIQVVGSTALISAVSSTVAVK